MRRPNGDDASALRSLFAASQWRAADKTNFARNFGSEKTNLLERHAQGTSDRALTMDFNAPNIVASYHTRSDGGIGSSPDESPNNAEGAHGIYIGSKPPKPCQPRFRP